jgi:hypothetical protein
MFNVINRKQAHDSGARYFFTGKPCARGHIDRRYTGTGICLSCSKSYSKRFKALNRDQVSLTVTVNRNDISTIEKFIEAINLARQLQSGR